MTRRDCYRCLGSRTRQTGFTLVEATVALAITGLAASALLMSLAAATTSTDDAVRRYLGWGIAQTLIDEISGMRYMESGASPYDSSLTAGNDERSAVGRTIYDDIDDYNGLRYQPPLERNGQTLGNDNGDTVPRDPRFRVPAAIMDRWKVECDVFYANERALLTPLANTVPTNYRTIRVRVYYVPQRGSQLLAQELFRTFAYVPEP